MVKTRLNIYWAALFAWIVPSWLVAQTSSLPFSIPPGASETFISDDATGPLNIGYARIQSVAGTPAPGAFGILQNRADGILISETTMPSSPPTTSSRNFFVEAVGNVNTGVAIANPNPEPATISFAFQDQEVRFRSPLFVGSFTIPPNSQISRFINEPPFNMPAPYFGLMSIESSIPVSVTALRGITNERFEFLVTTIVTGRPRPGAFVNVQGQPRTTAGYLPRFADGGGWKTEIVLVNDNTTEFANGTLEFIGASGEPVAVTIDGQTASTFEFGINRRDFVRVTTDGAGSDTRAGYVRLIGNEHSSSFSSFAIYSYESSGTTVSTASLPMVQPGASFRLYVDQATFPELLQTGIAISNPLGVTSIVLLELTDVDGNPTGLTSAIQLPPFGQFAKFLTEIPGFTTVPFPSRAVLRITGVSGEITVAGFRGHINSRSEFLMSSVLPALEGETSLAAETVLPQVVEGSGYSTQVVLFNNGSGASSGTVTSVSGNGTPLTLSATSP